MKKESVKKFDLEAAFKALDEIEIPQTKGIKANRVDLKERFGHKPATEVLVEDYYDVSSNEDLEDAKEERDGEIAKAKLARIEKIVDLNAEKPEDLLPSYVGKVIMQCPQCMTLFYKNPEDIEPSEENPDIVNLDEPCQHCGNTSGYNLIGKVGAVTEDEADKYDETSAEENELDLDFDKGTEEVDAEGTGEGAKEMSDEESSESKEDSDLDLNLDEVPEEEPEEEKKEESLKEKYGKQKITEEYEDDSTLPTIYNLFLDGKLVYESESIPLDKALSEITAYIKKLTPEQKKSFSLSWEFDESGYYNTPIYNNEGNIVGSRNDWKEVGGDVIVGVYSEAECKEYGYTFPEDRFVVNVDYAGDAIRKALDADVTANLKEGKSKVKESKTTKQRLTVIEPGYQYKDKNGNIYTLYGDELEEDDTGIVYDWEFVNDENGDIYIRESLKEAIDKDLDAKLKAHNDYIDYLKKMLEQEEKALSRADNEYVKKAIQRRIDAFKADLEDALPEELKNEVEIDLPTAEEIDLEATENVEEPKEETKESLALKESVESEIDSIIASWDVNESLIKEDKSMPLRSIEIKDKENSKKGIIWQVFYGGKENLHKEFKNEEEAKKFAKENNGKLMPLRTTEVESLNEDLEDLEANATIVDYVEYKHSYCHALEPKLQKIKYYANVLKKPVNYIKAMVKNIIKDSPEVRWTDKEQWFMGKLNEFWPNSYELYKFIKNSIKKAHDTWVYVNADGELIPELNKDMISLPVKESLKEYWWEDNDPMNWSDKEPLVYSCYYNSKLLGYLEYPYMGQEEYPTTVRADIIKHFKLPKGYNSKEISWRYIENEPLDETKPLVKVNESLKEYWWEDNDPMNWSDKEPLVYSCYYNSKLLGYLEYPYMGQEEYPTTIRADIIKHFKLPKGYNPKEISWQYIENDPLDETKPLVKVNESLTEEGNLDRLLDSDEFKTPVSEEEINAARREVAKESLKEEKEDESMAPTIYNLFLDDKLVYESESIPLNKALSEIITYIKKLTPEQKKSFSLSWEFDESEHDGYHNVPIYDNEGNIVGSKTEWVETEGDVVVGVFSEAECKEYGYAFPEERFVVNVDYAGDAIRKAFDDEESKEVEIEEPEFSEDDIDELDEDSLNKHIDEYLKEVYSNVKSYKTTGCELKDGKLIVEGKISFNSGKEKLTMFEFLPAYCKGNLFFEGYNKDFSEDKAFTLNCSINEAKKLITESFGYKYKINKNLVKGLK